MDPSQIASPVKQPRRVSGFALLVALLATFAAGKPILYDTLDPDSFWHLRVANQLHQQGIAPIVDEISFASIKQPWTPYSWLAELGMKAIWDIAGYRGAIATQALMMGGFVIFIALAARELTQRDRDTENQNPIAVIVATTFAMYIALPFLSFRPVTFVFVMLALCAWLLLRDRRLLECSRAVWWLGPITVLVTNCHFFSIVIPLWVSALMVGSVVEGNSKSSKRYGWLLLVTLLACCMTPMLPGVVRQIWSYQTADPMVSAGLITELRPFWVDPICTSIVASAIGCAIFNRRRLRAGEWFWLIGSLVLYIRLARLSPAYAPIAAASLAACLPQFSGRVLERFVIRVAVASIIALGIVRLAIEFPHSDRTMNAWLNRHAEYGPGYPAAAAEYVASHVHPDRGRLINEFSWGGYLAWKLGDHYQVLVDGRTQLFAPKLWQSLYLENLAQSRPVLESALADAAILPVKKSRFAEVLRGMGWQTAYRDNIAEVLLPPAAMIGRSDDSLPLSN